jgi:predicted Na+-dependent transporter
MPGIAVPFALFTLLYLLLGAVVVATMRRTVAATDPRRAVRG